MILEGKYYIEDIESGKYYEVKKEIYEKIKECRNTYTRVKNYKAIKPIIFGTGGECETNGLADMFYNPEKYQLKSFSNEITKKDLKKIIYNIWREDQ